MYEVARAGLFRTFHPPMPTGIDSAAPTRDRSACSRLPSKNYARRGWATVGLLLGHQAGLRLHFSRLNQHFGITQVKGNKRPRLVRKVDLLIGVYFVLA